MLKAIISNNYNHVNIRNIHYRMMHIKKSFLILIRSYSLQLIEIETLNFMIKVHYCLNPKKIIN